MKRRYDRHRDQPEFHEGDLVLLSHKSYTPHQGKRKLMPRYAGPYLVARQVHPNAYELNGLPPEVPKTQSIKFLRLFHPSPTRFASRPEPNFAHPTRRGDHYEWEVSKIDDHRIVVGGIQYRVRWAHSPDQHWLRPNQLKNCQRLLREYQTKHGITPSFWSDDESSLESSSGSETDTNLPPRPRDEPTTPERTSRPPPATSWAGATTSTSLGPAPAH